MPRPKKTAPAKRPTIEEVMQRWPDIRLPKPLRDALKRNGEYEIAVEGCGVISFSRLGIDVDSGFLILRNVQNRKQVPLDGYIDPRRVVYVTERPTDEQDETTALDLGDEDDGD